MKKLLLLISVPLILTATLLVLKYAVFGEISLFWALSPLWLTAIAAIVVFYAVWLNIAWQRWRLDHGRKICRNCDHCSLAELRPGRHLCLDSVKEVSPTQKGCDKFKRAAHK